MLNDQRYNFYDPSFLIALKKKLFLKVKQEQTALRAVAYIPLFLSLAAASACKLTGTVSENFATRFLVIMLKMPPYLSVNEKCN